MNNYVLWDDEGRKILGKLAQFIMPLDDWLKKKIVDDSSRRATIQTSFHGAMEGMFFRVDRLRLIDFIEMLARELANDAFLLHRWAMLEDKPLTFCPIECKEDWREARGLDDDVKFGPVLAETRRARLSAFQSPDRNSMRRVCRISVRLRALERRQRSWMMIIQSTGKASCLISSRTNVLNGRSRDQIHRRGS